MPNTGLGAGVINGEAVNPVLGANRDQFYEKIMALFGDNPPDHLASPESIEYAALSPELLVEHVLYAIDQPWGVNVSDITIRATNDDYII